MTVKYHKSADGEYRICTAQKRCRLQPYNEHVTLAVLTQQSRADFSGSDAFQEIGNQLDGYDDVHYRLYLPKGETKPKVVCVQSFDYYDYDGSRFLTPVAYTNEKEAAIHAEEYNESEAPAELRKPVSKAVAAYRANVFSDQEARPFHDVINQLENYDDAHYRVYLSQRTNTPVLVCVQSFDYYDYESERFLEKKAYLTEEEANKALADWV